MKYWTDPDGTFHEIYTASILVGNSFLGTFQYDSGRKDLAFYRESFAFFCPHCGDIWGRIAAENSRGQPMRFRCIELACEAHPDYWNIPGSLLWHELENLLPLFPPDAVRREFQLYLNLTSKELA